jgi:hypothetical protein
VPLTRLSDGCERPASARASTEGASTLGDKSSIPMQVVAKNV